MHPLDVKIYLRSFNEDDLTPKTHVSQQSTLCPGVPQ